MAIPASVSATHEIDSRTFVSATCAQDVNAGDAVQGMRGVDAIALFDAPAGTEIIALQSGQYDGALEAWQGS